VIRYAYDFETNGLFADSIRPGTKDPSIITRVHCLVMQDVDTGAVLTCHDSPEMTASMSLKEGVALLLAADARYAHNGLLYDERVIREFFPAQWASRGPGRFLDTQVGAAVVWPTEHLRRMDAARIAKAKNKKQARFPRELAGRHSLAAWGARLGNRKAEYEGGWKTFTPEMLSYCVQDVSTLTTIVRKLERKITDGHFTVRAWELEQDFKLEIARQMQNGFRFDREAADRLTAELQMRRAAIGAELAKAIPPFTNHTMTDPKVVANAEARVKMWADRLSEAGGVGTLVKARKAGDCLAKARERLAAKQAPKVEVVEFNPNSRHHVARHLMERHGWQPDLMDGYNKDGSVKTDESVLEELKGRYPLVDKIVEHKVVTKVLGMVAESLKKGAVPWVKMVGPDGAIHGFVDHNGAVTSRCTHSKPNMTCVPKVGSPYGRESRALFVPSPGNVLVGIDASGLELRMLGHYLAKYDGGEYANVVAHGDPHTRNQQALGIPDGPMARDTAKRAIYAELYGAGEVKLGKTIDPGGTKQQQKARGRKAKQSLLANVKGLRPLKERCANLHKRLRSVNLPDGRRAWTREDYSSLNTLLQASGAVVMKLAVVLMHRRFREEGLQVRQVHQAHDEVQLDVRPEIAKRVGEIGCWAITQAGVEFGMKCPLKGEWKTGKNWAETH